MRIAPLKFVASSCPTRSTLPSKSLWRRPFHSTSFLSNARPHAQPSISPSLSNNDSDRLCNRNPVKLPITKVVILRKVTLLEQIQSGCVGAPAFRSLEDQKTVHAHRENQNTLDVVQLELRKRGIDVNVVDKLQPSDVAWSDLVITVGGDGTFLTATHQIGDADSTPILGVNSSPGSSYGFFCAADRDNFGHWLDNLSNGAVGTSSLWRLRVFVNKVPYPILALNDCLYAAEIAACTSRYSITDHGRSQLQKSSGVWISTAAGSTAAIRSAGGQTFPLTERKLQYRVRELFPESIVGEPITSGYIENENDFQIVSRIHNARLFLDGHRNNIELHFGDVLNFSPSREALEWVRPTAPKEYWRPERWRSGWSLTNNGLTANGT